MKKFLIAAAVSVAAVAVASAADLPAAPVYKAPVVAPAPVYSWSGCYIGGNGGGKWFNTTSETVNIPAATGPGGTSVASTLSVPDATSTSGIGGGQIGCNWQSGRFVFGIEGDADWQHASTMFAVGRVFPVNFVPGDNFSVASNWQASVRGRIGYAWDRALLYATGGFAFTNVNFGTDFIPIGVFPATVASDSQTLVGATLGGGLEYGITNNLSLGVEGRYTWYGSQTFNSGVLSTFTNGRGLFTTAPTTSTLKLNTAEVTARLNWRFDWGGPVVARY